MSEFELLIIDSELNVLFKGCNIHGERLTNDRTTQASKSMALALIPPETRTFMCNIFLQTFF
jgi:hypothetical protein